MPKYLSAPHELSAREKFYVDRERATEKAR